jgi:hypothetical protein
MDGNTQVHILKPIYREEFLIEKSSKRSCGYKTSSYTHKEFISSLNVNMNKEPIWSRTQLLASLMRKFNNVVNKITIHQFYIKNVTKSYEFYVS